jgi:hypothetical protein
MQPADFSKIGDIHNLITDILYKSRLQNPQRRLFGLVKASAGTFTLYLLSTLNQLVPPEPVALASASHQPAIVIVSPLSESLTVLVFFSLLPLVLQTFTSNCSTSGGWRTTA